MASPFRLGKETQMKWRFMVRELVGSVIPPQQACAFARYRSRVLRYRDRFRGVHQACAKRCREGCRGGLQLRRSIFWFPQSLARSFRCGVEPFVDRLASFLAFVISRWTGQDLEARWQRYIGAGLIPLFEAWTWVRVVFRFD